MSLITTYEFSYYQASPFFQHLLPKFEEIKAESLKNDLNLDNNIYCSLDFGEYVIRCLVPFITFWSVILNPDKNHSNNATAENNFKIIKLENEKQLKAGRFIETIYSRWIAMFKTIDLLPSQVILKNKNTRIEINESDNIKSEESWNRKNNHFRD